MIDYKITDGKVQCTISGEEIYTAVVRKIDDISKKLSDCNVSFGSDKLLLNYSYAASAKVIDGDEDKAKRVACRRAKLKIARAVNRRFARLHTTLSALSSAITLEMIGTNDNVHRHEKLLDEVCE